jgi:hypothetical protein
MRQNDLFFFSADEYKVTTTTDGNDVVTRTAPGMRLSLNSSFLKQK